MEKIKWRKDKDGFWILEVDNGFKKLFTIILFKSRYWNGWQIWMINELYGRMPISDYYLYLKDAKETGLKIATAILENY